MEERDIAIKIEGLRKRYRLGTIGGGTLQGDIQSWWARKRGKEDPNSKIGAKQHSKNEIFYALDGIDLTIYKGERIGIIGHNGAGKSTLLKLLSRVTAPTEGRICIDGRIASMLEVGTGFNGELTGRENIYLNGAILGMSKAEVDAKMEQIIEFSECRQFIDTPVKRYSSGMYVKLAFSVAAHLDSEIMIMDEVLAVGDMAFQKKCLGKMKNVSLDEGRTVLYVSHNMNTIRQLCERCIVMDHGKIIFDGDVEEAIEIYMGTTDWSELPVKYDVSNKERDHHFGQQIKLNTIEFVNKSKAIFETGEAICIGIDLTSNIIMDGLQMVLRVKDGSNVGLIVSSLSDPFDMNKGDNKHLEFSFDSSGLVEDNYCLTIEIIKRNQVGTYFSYDNAYVVMPVQMINKDENDIRWSKKYWGNIQWKNMAILSETRI